MILQIIVLDKKQLLGLLGLKHVVYFVSDETVTDSIEDVMFQL